MNWLLIFIPIAVVLEHVAPDHALWIFLAAALAIMPLAGWGEAMIRSADPARFNAGRLSEGRTPVQIFPLVLTAWIAIALIALPADAGETLALVQSRGVVRCGVSDGILGFSAKDTSGRWSGLDADFCRAVAAAVLGDAEKATFVSLKSSTRFPALQARTIDLLVRNTSWTLTREATLKVQFPAVLFYDSQGFMVAKKSAVKQAADLKGATVCVEKGTTHEQHLVDYFGARGIGVKPVEVDSAREVAQSFFAGRCLAYTSDVSQLAAARLSAPGGPSAFVILPERISKEPLGPVVLRGDDDWITLVRWVLFTLVTAEECGVTRDNVAAGKQVNDDPRWGRLRDPDDQLAKALGMRGGWAVRAIKAVGNYGEMFERNLGRGSPLNMERGLNRLWTDGGLMYAPPVH